MMTLDTLVAKTLTPFLILAGLGTTVILPYSIDVEWAIASLNNGLIEYTDSVEPIVRHWGIMVFGMGAMLLVSAFRPWLRFEVMIFSTVEKSFMVYLYLAAPSEWNRAYLGPFIGDALIVLYSLLYFVSSHGRPRRWARPGS